MDEFTSALDVAAAIRRKEVSPLEVLDATLARVDERNPALNAIIWRNDDEARNAARALGSRIASGASDLPPFAGVPIPIKDLTPVTGQPLTNGSFGAPNGVSDHNELVVEALGRAGFIFTGRTNTPEFGLTTVTENLRYGPTRNPWNIDYTTGGSSGGAGSALASGMFSVVHGNDGGGSIRIPASCCGLVGLKPTRGRVPSIVPGWQGMSTEGVLTHSVADTAALLDVIGAPDPNAWLFAPTPTGPFANEPGADPGRLRVALNTKSALGIAVAGEAATAVEETGRLLEAAGHSVVWLDADVFDPDRLVSFVKVVNSGLAEYDDIDWAKVEPHNQAALASAKAVDSLTFARSLAEIQRMARLLVARFDDEFDLLVTPTMAIEPPRVGILDKVHASPELPPVEVLSMAAFTAVYNITGQPAISLPLHMAASGLPVGVQLVAAPWKEGLLLRVAAQLETAAPWKDRHPVAHGG